MAGPLYKSVSFNHLIFWHNQLISVSIHCDLIFRFGQSGGFTRLKERFDLIMGCHKSELTTSLNSEEKMSTEIIEKETENTNKVEVKDVPIITDSMEVGFYKLCDL